MPLHAGEFGSQEKLSGYEQAVNFMIVHATIQNTHGVAIYHGREGLIKTLTNASGTWADFSTMADLSSYITDDLGLLQSLPEIPAADQSGHDAETPLMNNWHALITPIDNPYHILHLQQHAGQSDVPRTAEGEYAAEPKAGGSIVYFRVEKPSGEIPPDDQTTEYAIRLYDENESARLMHELRSAATAIEQGLAFPGSYSDLLYRPPISFEDYPNPGLIF